MAKPSRATQEKRNRERSKKEQQQEKEVERVARKEERKLRVAELPEGEDPDLIGIVAGPQPILED